MREVEIRLDGLAFYGRHGVLAAERELGQRFALDLVLVPESARACDTDDVGDAVHYGEVAERALAAAQGGPYALLERLADAIAGELLDVFPLGAAPAVGARGGSESAAP